MNSKFQIAAGSVLGKEHQRLGRNHQDAYGTQVSKDAVIAVVSDGCGSGRSSEVGAQLGVQLTLSAITRQLEHLDQLNWNLLRRDLLHQILTLAEGMGDNLHQIMAQYFLFTIVGAVITQSETTIFWLGDGMVIINGQIQELGPFPNNAPPYLSYGLLPLAEFSDGNLSFQIQQLATTDLQSLLIGTDGVQDLIQATGQKLLGKAETVPPISQFWESDRYFQNPDLINRQLNLINRSVTKPDWANHYLRRETGLLPDDTTLVVIRKNPAANY